MKKGKGDMIRDSVLQNDVRVVRYLPWQVSFIEKNTSIDHDWLTEQVTKVRSTTKFR